MTDIYFYSRKVEYGWLSNFWRATQVIDGVEYRTNENFYQSKKALDSNDEFWIAAAPTPYAAMKAGRSLRPHEIRPDWDRVKFDIMLAGLRAKFGQNPDLAEKLLATGDAALHEDSPTDIVWGIKGTDMLGKLIMQVRDEIRQKRTSTP